MELEMWQWILANFAFPIIVAFMAWWFYYRKDENSVPRHVYEHACNIGEKIDSLIEYCEQILTDMKIAIDQILETSTMNTQATTALRETVANLCHLIDILLVMKGAGKDKDGNKKDCQ